MIRHQDACLSVRPGTSAARSWPVKHPQLFTEAAIARKRQRAVGQSEITDCHALDDRKNALPGVAPSRRLAGNDLATFPDFPAEIRAPVGTTYGVSAFQINFGAREIKTSGDSADVLVALNPAALKVELAKLKPGGVVIVDTGSFNERNLRKAGYSSSPLTDGSLARYRTIEIDVSRLTLEA